MSDSSLSTSPFSRGEARELVARARRLRDAGAQALSVAEERRAAARGAFEQARDEVVGRQLAEMPIARLRETTDGGVRFGAIEKAGYRTVGDVARANPHKLVQIRGVGEHSVNQVIGAARQLELAMKNTLWLRFETDRKPQEQKRLLETLAEYRVAAKAIAPAREELESLTPLLNDLEKRAKRTTGRLRMFFSGRRKREDGVNALEQLSLVVARPETTRVEAQIEDVLRQVRAKPPKQDVWTDYESCVAEYNGLLVDVGGLAPDNEAAQGFIPTELAQRVHEHPLDTELLRVSLRGYQAFGAKFALQQRHAMLGDEMGLGKTIEALAAMCHLGVQGGSHFMVVCPASVLVNWLHEVERHTELEALRLHGGDRETNFRTWSRRGGVGGNTFQALHWLYEKDFDVTPALLVVDEAHYVKNPRARRTMAVRDFIGFADRTLFLTGTPMENRVEEFRTLVHHLQPNVARKVDAVDGLAGAARFRSAVAPVYLRRNQTDVLQELPPRIETEEWVTFGVDDFGAYREAVAERNFMAMRQAAYLPGTAAASQKLARLVEIVEEATANDRKVIVFSFFRRVLDAIADELGDVAMGPLTGSVAPTKRQRLVDDFTATRAARVLVSQIEAGGVGLNIQAASVVLLTEPQWKPSIEEQAIGRCYRMGQARPVDVHRLLAEDSVDQRMLEILATKAALFDEYVRRSELKEISPDAVDVSSVDEAKRVASIAEEERRIIEAERRRLGLEN
jgi:superfamily II DNA or RNA helicase